MVDLFIAMDHIPLASRYSTGHAAGSANPTTNCGPPIARRLKRGVVLPSNRHDETSDRSGPDRAHNHVREAFLHISSHPYRPVARPLPLVMARVRHSCRIASGLTLGQPQTVDRPTAGTGPDHL